MASPGSASGAVVGHFVASLGPASGDVDRRAQCQINRYHGVIEKERGTFDGARDLFRHGLGQCENLDDALWQKMFLPALAEVNESLGNLREALDNHPMAWRMEDRRRA